MLSKLLRAVVPVVIAVGEGKGVVVVVVVVVVAAAAAVEVASETEELTVDIVLSVKRTESSRILVVVAM